MKIKQIDFIVFWISFLMIFILSSCVALPKKMDRFKKERKYSRTIESLIVALSNENINIRRDAIRALGKRKDPRAVELLIDLLKDEEATIRSYTAEALGELGDTRAVEPLILALKDWDNFLYIS